MGTHLVEGKHLVALATDQKTPVSDLDASRNVMRDIVEPADRLVALVFESSTVRCVVHSSVPSLAIESLTDFVKDQYNFWISMPL